MFGLSFGEIVLLLLIAIVVVGPRELPNLLRTIGEFIGRARRLATDLRAESGIDDILRDEGIQSEIDNFRRLASGVDLSASPPKYDYPPPPPPDATTLPAGAATSEVSSGEGTSTTSPTPSTPQGAIATEHVGPDQSRPDTTTVPAAAEAIAGENTGPAPITTTSTSTTTVERASKTAEEHR